MLTYRFAAVFAVVSLLAACSSSGARESVASEQPAAAATAQAAPAAETPKADRMVCKNIAPTGSRIAKKSCRTQSQWEEMARSGREATETIQRRGAQSEAPGD